MRTMTARSVLLSVLLGTHPGAASAAELVRLTAVFGVKETALRVALTRMVATGDLERSADGYRLSERLQARQRRQDESMRPTVRPWEGGWHVVIVTSIGAGAAERAELRNSLRAARFGELREGVWMRPDNLEPQFDASISSRIRVLQGRDDDPVELASRLWDLSAWAAGGEQLLNEIDCAPEVPDRFLVAAAIVRHLLADPVLPAELLPAGWPGARLRAAYQHFVAELASRRDSVQLTEAG